MSEFVTVDLSGKAPEDIICADCAKKGVLHIPTQAVLAYCSHNLSGCYRASGRDWKVIRGIEPTHFREAVLRGLTWGEVKADVEKGLLGIIQDQSEHAVKH